MKLELCHEDRAVCQARTEGVTLWSGVGGGRIKAG